MITFFGDYVIEHKTEKFRKDLHEASWGLLNDFEIEDFIAEYYKGKVKLYKITRDIKEIKV